MNTRTHHLTRRRFLHSSVAATAACAVAPYIHATEKWRTTPRATGTGEHTYEFIHDWISPPPHIAFGDTHGLTQDKDGRIYVAHTVNGTSSSDHAVCVYDVDGNFMRSWGGAFRGGAHGLDIREENGEEFLYHCDTRRSLVVKTSLSGDTVWEMGAPRDSGNYDGGNRYVPTNVAFAPDGDFFVGDGYGSSFIHRYDIDGNFKATIATPGSEPGQVKCPHGLWVDDRYDEPRLAVADRSNRRIQYFTLDGSHIEFITTGMREPCHFKTRGRKLLVPDLSSVVTLLDEDNKVITHLGDGAPDGGRAPLRGKPRKEFIDGKFICPHDAIFLHNGDILVAEWVPIGRVTLLKKV